MTEDVLEILIFNVGQAQAIFFYPRSNPKYGMFVDCAESEDCRPVDFLVENGFIHKEGDKYILSNLTVTNYDQDHFSGLPNLRDKAHIHTVRLANNVSSQELKEIKEEVTDALEHLCEIKDEYNSPVQNYEPPYSVRTYNLEQNELEAEEINTNHLSQLVFVEYCGSKICICGDLEESAWEKMLQKPEVQVELKNTNVMVAPHHGRDNGYHEDIFKYCKNLDCVIISDKELMYDTQTSMSDKYGKQVAVGVNFNGNDSGRKVLSTRSDGHLWIRFDASSNRTYKNFTI